MIWSTHTHIALVWMAASTRCACVCDKNKQTPTRQRPVFTLIHTDIRRIFTARGTYSLRRWCGKMLSGPQAKRRREGNSTTHKTMTEMRGERQRRDDIFAGRNGACVHHYVAIAADTPHGMASGRATSHEKRFLLHCLVCARHRWGLWMSAGLIRATNTFNQITAAAAATTICLPKANTDHALCQRLGRARKILQLSVDRCFRSLAFVAPQSKQKPEMEKSMFVYIAPHIRSLSRSRPSNPISSYKKRMRRTMHIGHRHPVVSLAHSRVSFSFSGLLFFFVIFTLRSMSAFPFTSLRSTRWRCVCVSVYMYRSIYSSSTETHSGNSFCSSVHCATAKTYTNTKISAHENNETTHTKKNRNRAAHRFCVQIAPDESAGSYNLEVEVFARKKYIQRKTRISHRSHNKETSSNNNKRNKQNDFAVKQTSR